MASRQAAVSPDTPAPTTTTSGRASPPPGTASVMYAVLVHEVDDVGQRAGVGVRGDAVAQVEDVAGHVAGRGEHGQHAVAQHRAGREQRRRVEVALQGVARADPPGGLGEGQPEVDADDVRARPAHRREQFAGPDAEVDPRHPQLGQRLENGRGRRLDMVDVVGERQRAHPRVEQLDGGRAGLDLDLEEGPGDLGEPVEQVAPQRGVADMSAFVRCRSRLGPPSTR